MHSNAWSNCVCACSYILQLLFIDGMHAFLKKKLHKFISLIQVSDRLSEAGVERERQNDI